MAPLGIREPNFNWKCMSKWWSAHSDGSHSPLREEELEKFTEIYLEPCTIDVVDQVHQFAFLFNPNQKDLKRIHEAMDPECRESPEIKALLKLHDLLLYTEYVDVAEALHEIHILAPFLDTVLCYGFAHGVYNKHASVRAKAADVVTAMVQNNPKSQQLVMDVNGLQPLFYNFLLDTDVTSRTKALGAISALIRNNKPGITAFLLEGGYEALRDALGSKSVEFQREALNLLQYLLHENSPDCKIVARFLRILMRLTSSDDAQVREAALNGLLVLARDEGGNSGHLVKNNDKLKQVLLKRVEGMSAMTGMTPDSLSPEGLFALSEEIKLVQSLWDACYNEPFSLGGQGLFMLFGF